MMKCDGDFSLQERVFDIMTFYEHPDDLYEAYLVPLDDARAERDRKRKETVRRLYLNVFPKEKAFSDI